MRKIQINKINPAAGTIEVVGNYASIFRGKYYRHPETEEVQPAYTKPAPEGFSLIKATTFELFDNPRYAGRYTVYTSVSSADAPSSSYTGDHTIIKVNEVIPDLEPNDPPGYSGQGYITHVSTYLIDIGTDLVVVPPETRVDVFPVELAGKDVTNWGEAFQQNVVNVARNFAGEDGPVNAFVGQMWYDTNDQQLRVWQGSSWELVNQSSFGLTYRHTQSMPAEVWTINHLQNIEAPYLCFCQFFVERGNGPQMIIPSNIEFINANQIRVTFSNPEIGYGLVRK